jgi:hypothetical protein
MDVRSIAEIIVLAAASFLFGRAWEYRYPSPRALVEKWRAKQQPPIKPQMHIHSAEEMDVRRD